MKARLAPLLLVSTLWLSVATAVAQTGVQAERVSVAFALAFGRAPSASEIADLSKQGPLSVADLLARHRQQLEHDAAANRATVVKAFEDAFGRQPTDQEINTESNAHHTYTELMKQHIGWLKDHPAEYADVIGKAYQLVIHRAVYPDEIEYWKSRDTLPYALLVGCVEHWGRRNSPGLMATTGIPTISVNSRYLATIAVSPAVAAEARAAAGLVSDETPSLASAGLNLVAPGSDHITTVGHMYFAAVGAAELVASGGR